MCVGLRCLRSALACWPVCWSVSYSLLAAVSAESSAVTIGTEPAGAFYVMPSISIFACLPYVSTYVCISLAHWAWPEAPISSNWPWQACAFSAASAN